jgi:chitin disaccharide deacetylase
MLQDKCLIVNADDFGIDEYINKGISDCFNSGIVRSVSIVPNGSAFEDALTLVKENADIGIGIHLCLVGERPILSRRILGSIIDDKGFLPPNYYSLFFKICRGGINFSKVKKELEAQIKKVFDYGITPTHIDSHQYTHLIPQIFNMVIELAKKYCIKWIRYPGREKYIHVTSMTTFMKKMCLSFLSKPQLLLLRKSSIKYVDFSHGFLVSGRLNEQVLRELMINLSSGLTDLTCHPGYSSKNSKYLSWKYHWEEEMGALTGDKLKVLIESLNIKLVNYATLNNSSRYNTQRRRLS